jgi:GntR family transcriptional regulator / MocR family aminotransferase
MPLPSSRQLADELGISRNTVTLAYEALATDGYIQTRRGVGTFVTESLPENCIEVESQEDIGNAKRAVRAVRRPRIAFQGERLRFVEKGPNRPPIDFWYGSTNPTHFPLSAWRQLLIDNLSRTSTNLADYGNPAGHLELRQAIAEHIGASRGIRADASQVIVTAGAQEAMNLACRLLIAPGTRVVVENPSYGGATRAFKSYGAAIVPVEVDHEGIDIATVEREEAVLAYVTPSHQFPTGVTLSLERRRRLLAWATTIGAYDTGAICAAFGDFIRKRAMRC